MSRKLPQKRQGMRLTARERRLVAFAQEQFGERLCTFLLAGLGEEGAGQRWRFVINYVGEDTSLLSRRVQVITYEPEDGSSYLPRRRDPLVLLALLHLLRNSEELSHTL